MAESLPYLSVIIPAYNEARRITATLDAVIGYLGEQSYVWEILIVLDGCTDGTADVVARQTAGNRSVRVINRPENRGKGYTVHEGMLAAKGRIRLFTDADNSTDVRHIEKMVPLFAAGNQVVIASRNHRDAAGAGEAVPQPLRKRILGTAGNLAIQTVAVWGIWDTQCGFKAFTAEAAEAIFTKTKIDGWGFDIEALALSRRLGFTIGIIPARWIDNTATHVTLASYCSVLLETLKVRWNLLCGAYDE